MGTRTGSHNQYKIFFVKLHPRVSPVHLLGCGLQAFPVRRPLLRNCRPPTLQPFSLHEGVQGGTVTMKSFHSAGVSRHCTCPSLSTGALRSGSWRHPPIGPDPAAGLARHPGHEPRVSTAGAGQKRSSADSPAKFRPSCCSSTYNSGPRPAAPRAALQDYVLLVRTSLLTVQQ